MYITIGKNKIGSKIKWNAYNILMNIICIFCVQNYRKREEMINEVLEYFPKTIREKINDVNIDYIEEIRLRVQQNLSVKIGQELKEINYRITPKELGETFENICEKSIYSYTRQIAEGFITIKGGNRVGITGSCVIEDGKIKIINNISSLNFRIAKQIKDVSIPILKDVIDLPNNTIFNTMIVSPPGGGKTTILRDLIRKISNRNARNWLYC